MDTIFNVKTQQALPVIFRNAESGIWMGSGLLVGLKSRKMREWFSRDGAEWESS